jgi:hypothetical protein
MPGITCSRFATVFALSLVGGLVLLAPGQSWTQEKHKLSWSARPENTKFTFQHTLEILDVPGHAIRMFEIRRTWPENPPTIEGLKVVEEIARGTTDSVAGNGRSWGYSSWRYENGDLSFGEWQNINQAVTNPDGSRKATFVGTYLTTGGTGKLRGLKGFGRYTGLVEFAPDGKVTRNEYSAEGEYWVEK